MNRYRVTGARPVLGNEPGSEFEQELTPFQEEGFVRAGWLEIVPQRYRVLTDTRVHDVSGMDADPTFEAALPIESEAALIAGGHIERMRRKPTTKQEPKDDENKKEANK